MYSHVVQWFSIVCGVVQAGSPQLAPAPQKDSEREKENDMKYTTLHVADTDVPLRDKVLMKSLSNTSTSSSDSKQSLSMFDNRAKVHICTHCAVIWDSRIKLTCLHACYQFTTILYMYN